MARPLRIQFPGASYHITCRGIEKRRIYTDDKDRFRFLKLLTDSLETYQVILRAYIMMHNHFHLLIQTRKANCSEFMRHFNICYTGWFNWRHDRCGNLYQGRYKAFLIDADSYLLEVSRYLHLNSARVRKTHLSNYRDQWRNARDYKWSSLSGYINLRYAAKVIDYDLILSMIGGRRAYRNFVLDGLRKDIDSPFKKARSRIILGDRDFAKKVKKYIKQGSHREQPSYRNLSLNVLEPETFLSILERELGITRESLQQRGANGVLRGMIADLLYKYCETTQGQIGNLLGDIDYVSVHQLRRRMHEKMLDDECLRRRYCSIEAKIKNHV